MQDFHIKLLSWTLSNRTGQINQTELDEEVKDFVDRLSELPEEEQLKIVNTAEKILAKQDL